MTKEELKKFEAALRKMKVQRQTARDLQDYLDDHDFSLEAKSYDRKVEAYDDCIFEIDYVIKTINIE